MFGPTFVFICIFSSILCFGSRSILNCKLYNVASYGLPWWEVFPIPRFYCGRWFFLYLDSTVGGGVSYIWILLLEVFLIKSCLWILLSQSQLGSVTTAGSVGEVLLFPGYIPDQYYPKSKKTLSHKMKIYGKF